jgi:hypothetical protein
MSKTHLSQTKNLFLLLATMILCAMSVAAQVSVAGIAPMRSAATLKGRHDSAFSLPARSGSIPSPVPQSIDSGPYSTLYDLVVAANGNPYTVRVTSSLRVDRDMSTPSTLSFDFERGGEFNVDSSKTLTVYSSIRAGENQRIFNGAGKVSLALAPISDVWAGWFGDLKCDQSADASAIINYAIASSFQSKNIRFPMQCQMRLDNKIKMYGQSLTTPDTWAGGRALNLIGAPRGYHNSTLSGLPSFYWNGPSGDPMIHLKTPTFLISGFGFEAAATSSSPAGSWVYLEETTSGEGDGYIEYNHMENTVVNTDFKGVRIGVNGNANNENIKIRFNHFSTSNDTTNTNASRGVTIWLDDNQNIRNTLIDGNWGLYGNEFLHTVNGSFHVRDNLLTAYTLGFHVVTNSLQDVIEGTNGEGNHQELKVGNLNGPLLLLNNHMGNTDSASSGLPALQCEGSGGKIIAIGNVFGFIGLPGNENMISWGGCTGYELTGSGNFYPSNNIINRGFNQFAYIDADSYRRDKRATQNSLLYTDPFLIDNVNYTQGTMSPGNKVLTSLPNYNIFDASMEGKQIWVNRAGPGLSPLLTTVEHYTDQRHVTLADAAADTTPSCSNPSCYLTFGFGGGTQVSILGVDQSNYNNPYLYLGNSALNAQILSPLTGGVTVNSQGSPGGLRIGTGASTQGSWIKGHWTYTQSWTLSPSLANGATTTVTVTAANAATGDTALVSFVDEWNNAMPAGVILFGSSFNGEVKVTVLNLTGGTLSLYPGTMRVDVWRH